MSRQPRASLRVWPLLACLCLIISLFAPPRSAAARTVAPVAPSAGATSDWSVQAAPTPTGSPNLVVSLIGAGVVGPSGIVPLLVTLNASAGESLATLEASASGADGQWQTLATLATPGPVTLATGFNLTLPAFGGDRTAGKRAVHLRASDASGNRSSAALAVVYVPELPDFGDVTGKRPAAEAEAIRQLAARGVIRGYGNGNFGPRDTTLRGQMAALIARAIGWDAEDWVNGFSDQRGENPDLWRNVGTLQHYGVTLGYGAEQCRAKGTPAPCFGPQDPVTYAQTISFITRAMVARGYWVAQPGAPLPQPDMPGGHAADARTFHHYTQALGGIPDRPAGAGWNDDATRGWFALAEWQVVRWLEDSRNWLTLPLPPFPHRGHGVVSGANTSDKAPAAGSNVTIGAWLTQRGQPKPGAALTATARFAGGSASCTGRSGGDGWASCQLAVTPPMAGQTVVVDTAFALGDAIHAARVVLTVPGSASPSPSAVPSASPSHSPSPTPSASPSANPSPLPSPSPVGSLPPDPATVAPPLAPGVATDFATGVAFLHSGTNPIQTGVQPGAIRPERAAVLSGHVITRDGQPLPGVRVAVKGHPELGSTLSRADGRYDLAVNGGTLVLDFGRSGYLPAQRQVTATWRDYTAVPGVALVPLSGQATVIDLNSTAPAQVARGEAQQDDDGSRRATLLFPQGTTATLTLPGGGTQPLTSLAVRATEYTVGANGPAAMPGDLPATSAYTYAVELSADEALAAGATSVQFSQPVPLYVENFLGFPVGTAVPAGYYDRERAAWIPADNGRVIKLLAVTGGLADLDTDGDGAADNATTLAALGITDAERQQLAILYSPGQTLWRTPIPHFTPWDCNWPYGPPPDARGPQVPMPTGGPGPGPNPGSNDGPGNGDDSDSDGDDPSQADERAGSDDCESGSVILCRDQILNEMLGIVGTDLRLVYSSGRAPGRSATYALDIPLSGQQTPASLQAIVVQTHIAGQLTIQRFSPAPNQRVRFEWDGRDRFGRRVYSSEPISVQITYEYPLLYYPVRADFASSFGSFAAASRASGQFVGGRRGGATIAVTQVWNSTLRRPQPEATAQIATLGGWTIDQYHQYDPRSGTLYLGDGTRRSLDVQDRVLPVLERDQAAGIPLAQPWGIAVAPDGTAYVADAGAHRIWRVAPDGTRAVVAGTGAPGFGGDGGAAAAARLNAPKGLAIGPDGSLYIADSGNHRIRRVDPAGIISTVAGTGAAGFGGDGGQATAAVLSAPESVAVAADGTLYIADTVNNRVRRVALDGRISTAIGGGGKDPAEGDTGVGALLYRPKGLSLGPDGRLYFINVEGVEDTGGRAFRLDPDGTLHPILGGLTYPQATVVGPDGSLFIGDDVTVRRVSPRGNVTTVDSAGGGLNGLAYGPDGYLYFAHGDPDARAARVGPSVPGFLPGEFGVPSSDGDRVYIFAPSGQHLRTVDALTGALIWQFAHDGLGRLVAVDDGDGNVTTIEYNGNRPAAIVAPYGQRTTLTVDANGWLATVTDPGTRVTRLTTTPDGLLTGLIDPRGGAHHFSYTGQGYLTRDEDPDGRAKTLIRAERPDGRGFDVTVTTTEGRVTVYGEEHLPDGTVRRSKRFADGTTATTVVEADGTMVATQPDGGVITTIATPDPRWGLLAPLSQVSARWPDGRTYTRTIERTVALSDPRDFLAVARLVDLVTVNGRATTTTYVAATRTTTTVTPENRVVTTALDERGRVARHQRAASLLATTFTYDGRGRLETVSQGSGAERRLTTLAYGADGFLASLTDPLNRVTTYARDPLGRITGLTRPDGKVIGFGHDGQDNLTQIAPPGGAAHTQGYTPAGRGRSYEAPPAEQNGATARTEYVRDRDGLLTGINRADGVVVGIGRDGAGRMETITTPRGQVVASYDGATGLLKTLNAPGGVALTFGYDGSVATNETWGGPVVGSVGDALDANLWLASRTVNGQVVAYGRDGDGRVTRVDALTLTPDPATGLPVAAGLGGVTSAWGYDGFAAVGSTRTAFNNGTLYQNVYTRDKLGRVTRKLETIGGATATYDYAYDLAGRLTEVKLNGLIAETYTYDDNGNRLTATTVAGSGTATYDGRDRLIQQGGATYAYTAEGELRTKTVGGQVTTYSYDPRGALLAVALPNGRAVEYLVDGLDRRVGKRVDSTLVQGFLYAGDRIVAELDGTGTVGSTFVYADGIVPAYLIKGGVNYRLVTDQVGSVRLVVNAASGQVAQRLDYDAFGNVTLDTNPGFQPFGFAGGLYDRDTGLVRFGARDYDPQAGRWTAKDPILFGGGQANLYAYVGDDPINRIDPSGLAWDTWMILPDGQRAGIDRQHSFHATTGKIALMDGGAMTVPMEVQYHDGIPTSLWQLPAGTCFEPMTVMEQIRNNVDVPGLGDAWRGFKRLLGAGDAKFGVETRRYPGGVRG